LLRLNNLIIVITLSLGIKIHQHIEVDYMDYCNILVVADAVNRAVLTAEVAYRSGSSGRRRPLRFAIIRRN